jgi:hypothetical protein
MLKKIAKSVFIIGRSKMDFHKCANCGEYANFPKHRCDPKFYVFQDDDQIWDSIHSNDKPYFQHGADPKEAAEKYCNHHSEFEDDFDLFLIESEKFHKIINDYTQSEELATEDCEYLTKIIGQECSKFHIESELSRTFYATEFDDEL